MRGWLALFALLPAMAAHAQSGVALSWVAPAGETFNVYRGGTVCGGGFIKITSGVTTLAYTDTTVRPGGTYSYQVTAVAGGQESAPSNCIVMVIPPVTLPPPPAPTSLTGTLTSN
jgi:hypothetical protein